MLSTSEQLRSESQSKRSMTDQDKAFDQQFRLLSDVILKWVMKEYGSIIDDEDTNLLINLMNDRFIHHKSDHPALTTETYDQYVENINCFIKNNLLLPVFNRLVQFALKLDIPSVVYYACTELKDTVSVYKRFLEAKKKSDPATKDSQIFKNMQLAGDLHRAIALSASDISSERRYLTEKCRQLSTSLFQDGLLSTFSSRLVQEFPSLSGYQSMITKAGYVSDIFLYPSNADLILRLFDMVLNPSVLYSLVYNLLYESYPDVVEDTTMSTRDQIRVMLNVLIRDLLQSSPPSDNESGVPSGSPFLSPNYLFSNVTNLVATPVRKIAHPLIESCLMALLSLIDYPVLLRHWLYETLDAVWSDIEKQAYRMKDDNNHDSLNVSLSKTASLASVFQYLKGSFATELAKEVVSLVTISQSYTGFNSEYANNHSGLPHENLNITGSPGMSSSSVQSSPLVKLSTSAAAFFSTKALSLMTQFESVSDVVGLVFLRAIEAALGDYARAESVEDLMYYLIQHIQHHISWRLVWIERMDILLSKLLTIVIVDSDDQHDSGLQDKCVGANVTKINTTDKLSSFNEGQLPSGLYPLSMSASSTYGTPLGSPSLYQEMIDDVDTSFQLHTNINDSPSPQFRARLMSLPDHLPAKDEPALNNTMPPKVTAKRRTVDADKRTLLVLDAFFTDDRMRDLAGLHQLQRFLGSRAEYTSTRIALTCQMEDFIAELALTNAPQATTKATPNAVSSHELSFWHLLQSRYRMLKRQDKIHERIFSWMNSS